YSIDLGTGAATLVASVPKALAIAMVARSCFTQLDFLGALGNFASTTGPNGRPAVQVTVTDPEFSSGLDHIYVSGSNLAIHGMNLPCTFQFDRRQEITQYTFVAEKINASSGASLTVQGVDCAGIIGDPPINLLLTDKGK